MRVNQGLRFYEFSQTPDCHTFICKSKISPSLDFQATTYICVRNGLKLTARLANISFHQKYINIFSQAL
ncbi:hypothetical protein QT971_09420 [Microcoleus sp. herbarium19]